VRFYEPDDKGNPMRGWYCVATANCVGFNGPGKWGVSVNSLEHAAYWFLRDDL
jgi:hypothetical protein